MDFLNNIEYNELKNEVKKCDLLLKSQQIIFEQQLKNGLGDEIKKYLANPPKPDKKLERKIKWVKFKQKLVNILLNENGQE